MATYMKRLGFRVRWVLDGMERTVPWTWWVYIMVVLFVSWEVMMRYFFNRPHIWYEETSVIACLLICFLGCGIGTREKGQIALTFLYERFSMRTRRVVDIVIHIATLAVSVMLVIGLFNYASSLNRLGAIYASRTPYSFVAYAIVVGMCINVLFSFGNLLESIGISPSIEQIKEKEVLPSAE